MALTVFKVVFFVVKQCQGFQIVKTITDDGQGWGFNLQSRIDAIAEQLEKEGYSQVRLCDVQNISTPIIRKRY